MASQLHLDDVRRHSRQIALADVGPEGQARIMAAEVALVGDDGAVESAARYLAAAGVRRVRLIARAGDAAARVAAAVVELDRRAAVSNRSWPGDGAAWVEALRGATLVVRAGFDDDPMLRAAVRLGVPVVVVRIAVRGVDLLSFRQHGPCPHAALDGPAGPAAGDGHGELAVLAGTLAAAEALWVLARPGDGPRARHLRLGLGEGEAPLTQELPWRPECFACGGSATEAVLS